MNYLSLKRVFGFECSLPVGRMLFTVIHGECFKSETAWRVRAYRIDVKGELRYDLWQISVR
jgi:hypothetical protein